MTEIIDFHHHLLEEDNYADKLVKKMDELEIDKVFISGLGIGKGKKVDTSNYDNFNLGSLSPDNDDVVAAVKKYPDRLIGNGYVHLGVDTADKVDELVDKGFKGLKVTRPAVNYNDDACFPVYEKAEKYGLPILFHMGIVLYTQFDREDDVCSMRMHPVMVDRIARWFPNLKIVIAHMGVPWFEETAIMMRFHKNVYTDLTGASLGWRNRFAPCDYQKMLFWDGAFDKILFGTDTHIRDMGDSLSDHERLVNLCNLSEETKTKIFSGNAKELLHL